MNTISVGQTYPVELQPGLTLVVTAASGSTGRIKRHNNSVGGPLVQDWFMSFAGDTRQFGPFPTVRRYSIECQSGSITYDYVKPDNDFATQLGNMESFTGARTLSPEDNGKLLRCDDASNVVVTVPPVLPEGFNIGFAMWGTGTVTVSAASGATKRSTTSAIGTQYGTGSLVVLKNADGASAEFVLCGNFA